MSTIVRRTLRRINDQQNVTKTMTPRADHVPGLYSLQVALPPLTSGSVSSDQSESVSHSEHRSMYCKKVHTETSMHSSRMRTARLLAVSPSMHCEGGMLPAGCLPLVLGGCLPLVRRIVCLWSSGGGWCIPACTGADTTL